LASSEISQILSLDPDIPIRIRINPISPLLILLPKQSKVWQKYLVKKIPSNYLRGQEAVDRSDRTRLLWEASGGERRGSELSIPSRVHILCINGTFELIHLSRLIRIRANPATGEIHGAALIIVPKRIERSRFILH